MGRGVGCPFHRDVLGYPDIGAWQTQLTGRKVWTLVPETACLAVCDTLTFGVGPGDSVFFDAVLWGHSTFCGAATSGSDRGKDGTCFATGGDVNSLVCLADLLMLLEGDRGL